MFTPPFNRKNGILFFSIMLLIFFSCSLTWANETLWVETREPQKLELISGKSLILKSAKPITRISEPVAGIASVLTLSPYELYITGKGVGTTNLIIWHDKKMAAIYNLEVTYDLSILKQKIHEFLPEENGIKVFAAADGITLSGRVSSAANLSQAVALAQSYARKGKVHNLLEVGGVHQVMLEVKMAEMSRSTSKKLGINFNYFRNGEFGVSLLGGLSSFTAGGDAEYSPAVNALFRFQDGSTTWTGFIDALKEDGLVKVLAEPTLITLSGQTATFLAGGEFPVPVPSEDGISIEFKSFGVGLSFSPTVFNENKISMQVSPEVSEIDYSNILQLSGYVVPGLTTRKASTTIELGDGQSFAIAGLLKETIRDGVTKFPILGDIPILGALFRSKSFQKSETELVIIVTPHLVKPLDMAKQTLPTDYYVEPSDTEIYLEGLMEGRQKKQPMQSMQAQEGELDGEFGHAMPDSE